MRNSLFVLLLPALLLTPTLCFANESMGTPAAREEFEKGETARKMGDFRSAVQAYRRAIKLDPEFAKAHQNYIFVSQLVTADASGKSTQAEPFETEEERERQEEARIRKRLQIEYEGLARKHPDTAVYEWAIAWINLESQPQAAERYLHNALTIDPAYAPALSTLSVIDRARGNLKASQEDLRKAVSANPDNPEYLADYAYELKDANPQEFVRLSRNLLQEFPESDSASSALIMLAEQAATLEEKIRYLEMLKARFPPSKSYLSEGGMRMLSDAYDRIDPQKALALAKEMEKARPEESDWVLYASYEEQMISAEQTLANGETKRALILFDNIRVPPFANHAKLDMLRARAAEASGETANAYERLLKIFASYPTDDLQSAITGYGQKLGKTRKQINADVLRTREGNAKPAIPFTLPGYGQNKRVSLSDFKGRVTLLNFWFPECGPCQEEFTRLRAVFERYRQQGFVVVAVNIVPAQDTFVLPMLKGYQLDFIPARDDKKVSKAYGVRGVPANFLIGPDGQVWFHADAPILDLSQQRCLELQIESLLQQRNDMPNDGK